MKVKKRRREDTDKTSEIRVGSDPFQRLLGLMFKAHPWHGVSIGEEAPDVVTAYLEIVPTDTVKYEVDKHSGFLKVDRPQMRDDAIYGNFTDIIRRGEQRCL